MKVHYHKELLAFFEGQVKKFGRVETGGILLGWIDENSNIIVSKATDAGSNAIHDDVYFKADADYIDMIIDIEYANSGGKVVYLGEWHTHPQVHPEPSLVDLNSLREIVESSGKPNLLLILGAVGFSKTNFTSQSVSIIKLPNKKKFYELEAAVV